MLDNRFLEILLKAMSILLLQQRDLQQLIEFLVITKFKKNSKKKINTVKEQISLLRMNIIE